MGIDVWFERPSAAALAARVSADVPVAATVSALQPAARAGGGETTESTLPPSRRSTRPPPQGNIVRETVSQPVPVSGGERRGPDAAAPLATDSFALFCVRGDGLLLVAPMPLARTRQRLARDIVQAVIQARGGDRSSVQTVEFSYPPLQGGAAVASSPERVLRAFLDRQLRSSASSAGAAVQPVKPLNLLVCADALSRFSGWYGGTFLEIPSLDTLYGDADAKRGLWRLLSDG